MVGEHLIVPIGKACNAHLELFSNKLYQTYKNKILPDVFAAYCSESVLTFLTAGVEEFWIIMKDRQVRHLKGVDGASLCASHTSNVHKNPWNNLLYGRDALLFINDKDAIGAGLGYEECNNIMMHDASKYNEDGTCKNPAKLVEQINKHFFLTEEELNYKKMKTKFIK